MKIVLVGESWGKHEQKFQHPLVWYSGRELAKMLAEAQLAPPLRVPYPSETDMIHHWRWLRAEYSIAVTNVFQEHPDGDKTELYFDKDGDTELPSIRIKNRVLRLRPEYRHHVDRLWTELESWQPNVVVALGNYACWGLLGTTGIRAIRGTPKITLKLELKCIPTFHPAALRDESLRPDIVADLTKAKRESEYPEIRRIQRWITAEHPETREKITIDEIEAWFACEASDYTIDIETGYALFTRAELKAMTPQMRRILSELISMVSFARSPFEAVIIPFMTRDDENLNYWSRADEIKALRILATQLKSDIPKTFQNGIFDISHFLRMGLIVNNATDDTMIARHADLPESQKGLGYLGSIFTDEISWKQMRAGGEQLKREE